MPNNFTFRDLLVFLTTGFYFFFIITFIFCEDIFALIVAKKNELAIIKDFSSLLVFFIIPIAYIAGHLINGVDYSLLKYHVWVHKKLVKYKNFFSQTFLKINEIIFYRHRIVYHYIMYIKSLKNDDPKPFESLDDFWGFCNGLKNENKYFSAEYYYIINDMLKAIYLVSFSLIFLAFWYKGLNIALIISIIAFISYWRSRQYASFFIKVILYTVKTQKT